MADSLDNRHDTSDQYYDPYCDLCFDEKGRNQSAWGYCRECVQFLCSACNDDHKINQATRRHTVVHGDDMPQSQSAKPPKFNDCKIHHKHVNDQFCFEHQILLCPACSSSSHKSCTVMSVDDTCKIVQTSDVHSLNDTIKGIKLNLETVLTTMEANLRSLKKDEEKIMKEVERLHQEIIAKADQLIEKMKKDIYLKFESLQSDFARQHKQIKETVSNLGRALNDIARVKNKSIDTKLFLRLQGAAIICKESCKANDQDFERTFRAVSLSMTPSKEVQDFLSSAYVLGTLSISESKSDVKLGFPDIRFPTSKAFVAKSVSWPLQTSKHREKPCYLNRYKIQSDDGSGGCWVTGIAVLNDGRKLMVVNNKNTVKLFSKDMKAITSEPLPSIPWDITLVSDHEAVVSAYKQILRIRIFDDDIVYENSIPVSFDPYGITKYKDKLVATAPFNKPPSVNLIDLAGKVHWSVFTNKQGRTMFGRPWYVSSFEDQKIPSVTVTDQSKHALTVLNGDTGEIITRHQLKDRGPKGITTDTDDNIYVCCNNTQDVASMSADMHKERTLLSIQDLNGKPEAIAYDDKTNQLIISYCKDDRVDIYQL